MARPIKRFEWRGGALGAPGRIILYHDDESTAASILDSAVAEVDRLEREFSLFRPDSAISRLNREGALDHPSLDLQRVLATAQLVSEQTDGAFDVTVQPLWTLYARHFDAFPDDPRGPSAAKIHQALSLVGYQRLEVSPSRIRLVPGMAVTLNGIAQGYITDRVADLLVAQGVTDVLIDLGELRGLGRHGDGRPWQAVIVDPRRQAHALARVPVSGRAMATSAGRGTVFDSAGRFHHLFQPKTGECARCWLSATVATPRATLADALSTALAVAPFEAATTYVGRFPDVDAWLIDAGGTLRRVTFS